jgi:F-type H+-transporting ATPase subunit alpha
VSQVGKVEKAVLGEIKAKHPQVLEAIRTEREISKATDAKLTEILAAFAKTFA